MKSNIRGVRAVVGAIGALACACSAFAEPDVICGSLESTAAYGPIGGVRAYMVGTYTCNPGNTNLMWLSHGSPTVGFNAYRLSDGRLQQIGMSWCKTSCCAGAGSDPANCGGLTGCNGAGGSVLGAGCRDFYLAGINAAQGYLAPRSSINAFSGTIPISTPATVNAIDRRLQIAESAMSSVTYPGAQYFMESVFVASDETTDASRGNNVSYRRAAISPTFDLTLQNTTVIGEPAIKAWRLHGLGPSQPDTRVEDGIVNIPGEGRFYYAVKVTDLGGGQFRYDYAVFNQNSHISARGLHIPVPAGVVVSNIGFSDVAYHSSEPFSGVDWPGQRTATDVAWQTETFAANPNANALRWGTMYNFWFDANSAPGLGAGTLDLFRTPGTLLFMVRVPQAPPACAADFNHEDGVTVQDIYDFLAAWNATDPLADFNGVNGVTVQDIYDFLEAWNQGCP